LAVIHLSVKHAVFLQQAVDGLLKENAIIVKPLMFGEDDRSKLN
jgi:hypothetical protein